MKYAGFTLMAVEQNARQGLCPSGSGNAPEVIGFRESSRQLHSTERWHSACLSASGACRARTCDDHEEGEMRTISAIATITLIVVLVGGCSVKQTPEIQDQGSRRIDGDMDSQLAKVADRLPGFGGMFFDGDGDLNVYLVEIAEPADAQALEARKARVETAITAVFGPDLLVQGKDRRSEPGSQAMPERSPQIKIIRGTYDIPQLLEWRAGVDLALDVQGVLFTDLDERQNRLRVGVETLAARERVEALLARRGVPRAAVIIEQAKPDRFHATLRDERRPVQGGVQIEADTGIFSSKICTLGFNAFRSNVKGFVTNSHCTDTQGGSEGPTSISQLTPSSGATRSVTRLLTHPTSLEASAQPAGGVGSATVPSSTTVMCSQVEHGSSEPPGRGLSRYTVRIPPFW
jgi:hypothetical protein